MLAKVCEISGLRRGVGGVFAVLSCYAVLMDSPVPTFRNSLSVPSWGSSIALEDGPPGLSGNVVDVYLNKLRDNPEGRIPPQNLFYILNK